MTMRPDKGIPINLTRTALIRDPFSYGFLWKWRVGPYGSYDNTLYSRKDLQCLNDYTYQRNLSADSLVELKELISIQFVRSVHLAHILFSVYSRSHPVPTVCSTKCHRHPFARRPRKINSSPNKAESRDSLQFAVSFHNQEETFKQQ